MTTLHEDDALSGSHLPAAQAAELFNRLSNARQRGRINADHSIRSMAPYRKKDPVDRTAPRHPTRDRRRSRSSGS